MIDIHVHPGYGRTTATDILAYMDQYNISKCWLLSLESGGSLDEAGELAPVLNCEVYDMYKAWPEKFIPGFSLPPDTPYLQKKAERLIRLGFRVCGEFKVEGVPFDSPQCEKLYEVLEDKGVPLLFHIGTLGFSDRSMKPYRDMLRKYKSLPFIAHSMGWWKHISSNVLLDVNFPHGRVISPGEAEKMLKEFPNLHANLDMIEGINAMARDPAYAERFLHDFQQRLMFGSDFPVELYYCDPSDFGIYSRWRDALLLETTEQETLPEQYARLLDIFTKDAALRQDILHDNAERMIGR